jgi:protein tyrosine/serine phosphatase
MDVDPLDPDYVADVLSRPPFVSISGVHNVRDLATPATPLKPNLLFRGAEVAHITEQGKDQLRALGITTVFDLRSDTEIEKYNTPLPHIDGVDILQTPVFKREDYSPEMIAKRFQLYSSGKTEAFIELYTQILDHGGPAFGTILRHVRDRPNEGCLFHCTAGKDRTGVIAAILLKLVGATDAAIATDYALTRVGREPARQMVMARLSKEPIFASNSEAALNMFTCRCVQLPSFYCRF